MRTSGIAGRARLALVFVVAIAGSALAAETWVQCVPPGNSYVVTAVLVPGCGGAEVCGGDKGDGHVDFRIGFGTDMSLSVNGICAGEFSPQATYRVTVACQKTGCLWFATTSVVNQSTGAVVFHQANYPMPAAAAEAWAVADDVMVLSIQ